MAGGARLLVWHASRTDPQSPPASNAGQQEAEGEAEAGEAGRQACSLAAEADRPALLLPCCFLAALRCWSA